MLLMFGGILIGSLLDIYYSIILFDVLLSTAKDFIGGQRELWEEFSFMEWIVFTESHLSGTRKMHSSCCSPLLSSSVTTTIEKIAYLIYTHVVIILNTPVLSRPECDTGASPSLREPKGHMQLSSKCVPMFRVCVHTCLLSFSLL